MRWQVRSEKVLLRELNEVCVYSAPCHQGIAEVWLCCAGGAAVRYLGGRGLRGTLHLQAAWRVRDLATWRSGGNSW